MPSLAKNMRGLALVLSTLAAGFATSAEAASTCGINGSATATPAVYDPFNPTGLATTTITMNLTRVNTSGGGDTREVNFYLKANSATGTLQDFGKWPESGSSRYITRQLSMPDSTT